MTSFKEFRLMKQLLIIPALFASVACQSPDTVVLVSPRPVGFEIGASEFPFDDRITIDRVTSWGGLFAAGADLTVSGSYDLRSRPEATLYLGTTSTSQSTTKQAKGGNASTVLRGQGTFELQHTIPGLGYPHVTFYDTETGKPFAGSYFGRGEYLLREADLDYGRTALGLTE
ncbi:MAG: hypothetical protein GY930_00300 [bacterium]|nr:hypothetical protein [bacterium]